MLKKKEIFKRFALVFSSVIISIMIGEIILRSIGYYYCPVKIEINGTTHDWRYHCSFGDTHFEYDPYLFWRPRKKLAVFNSQGYRGEVLQKKKKATEYRIFTIGDSNTLGWLGDDGRVGSNWPIYLEEIFRKNSNNDVVVINAGVWGYSSLQGLRRFQEALQFEPNMVLISFGSNDIFEVVMSDKEFSDITSSLFRRFFYKLRIGQLIIDKWDEIILRKKNAKNESLVHRVNIDDYKAYLSKIIEIANEYKIKCIMLTRPFFDESPNNIRWKNFIIDYGNATKEVAINHNIQMIDIYSYFDGKKEYFADTSHFNEIGHRLAAKVIYDQIKSSALK